MKTHMFNEAEVLMLERTCGIRRKQEKWKEFLEVVRDLGGEVKLTGARFLTHKLIGLDEEDFKFIQDFIK